MSDAADAGGFTSQQDISQIVAGLSRRVRRLEEEGSRPGSASPPRGPSSVLPADWKQWAQRHGWTAVYVFMAVVDIVACLVFKDWMLGVAAVTMVAFAWLSYDAAA